MSGYWVDKNTKSGKIFSNNDIDIEEYIGLLYRALKPQTHCYIFTNNVNLPHFLDVISRSQFKFVKSLIWDKCSKIAGRYYMGCYEYILFLRKGGDRSINDCGTGDILRVPVGEKPMFEDGSFVNPTAKPVELYEILIKNSSSENDLVLDPFCGSGTIGRACKKSGRRYIGFDIDAAQIEYARKSVSRFSFQRTIFG